jgi:YfiH family protein
MTVADPLSLDVPIALPSGAWALFTSRRRGSLASTADSGTSGQPRDHRRQLCTELGLDCLEGTRQVHGATVIVRNEGRPTGPPTDRGAQDGADDVHDPEADGQVTSRRRVGLVALGADCVPVLLAAPSGVAALHAGWRGLAAGVLEAGVAALEAIADDGPIAAAVGPAAGVCCYEVGPEVRTALGDEHCTGTHADLHSATRARLRAAGVNEVAVLAACTICDPRLFSHRREGAGAGRHAGIVWRR